MAVVPNQGSTNVFFSILFVPSEDLKIVPNFSHVNAIPFETAGTSKLYCNVLTSFEPTLANRHYSNFVSKFFVKRSLLNPSQTLKNV